MILLMYAIVMMIMMIIMTVMTTAVIDMNLKKSAYVKYSKVR